MKASRTIKPCPARLPVTDKMWPDIRLLVAEMMGVLGRWRIGWIIATLLVLWLTWTLVYPLDALWLKTLRAAGGAEWKVSLKKISGWIGRWGDFAGYNLIFTLALWFGGRLFRSRYFQRLAVASMLAAIFAGLLANVFRFASGRPRPSAEVADGFYGPQVKWNYNAFPSGHTATAFGSSLPVLIAAPQVGIPAAIFAASVSWARMHRNQHHPSDIVVAFWIALLFGLPLGHAVRKTRFKNGDEEKPAAEESATQPQPAAMDALPN